MDVDLGLVGDNWKARGNPLAPDGKASLEAQVTVINARLLNLVAQAEERWPLAGDQLVVDLDLSVENLPPGTRLCIGSAVLEVSAKPHTGCHKFEGRFGREALKFISSPVGRSLRLRGLNARVVEPGDDSRRGRRGGGRPFGLTVACRQAHHCRTIANRAGEIPGPVAWRTLAPPPTAALTPRVAEGCREYGQDLHVVAGLQGAGTAVGYPRGGLISHTPHFQAPR